VETVFSSPQSGACVESISANIYYRATNSIIRICLPALGIYALLKCIKWTNRISHALAIGVSLLIATLTMSIIYTTAGGLTVVNLYAFAIPYIVTLWASCFFKNASGRRRELVALFLCFLSAAMLVRTFSESIILYDVSNVTVNDMVSGLKKNFDTHETYYIIAAPAEVSAQISYLMLQPFPNSVQTSSSEISHIIKGNSMNEFISAVNNLPYKSVLILLPERYPYVSSGAWSSYYLLKDKVFVELNQQFSSLYDSGFYRMYTR
jgi:hypothetical protein